MNPNKLKLSFAEALRGKPVASSSPTKELNTSEETQSSLLATTGDSERSPNASSSSALLMDITSTTGSSTSSSFASRCAAERELLRESKLNEIADETCKLCDGKLDKARLLSCLHIFCENCLKKLLIADKVHVQPPMQIECPLCKQLTELEKNDIESLVCDFLHSNILDLANVKPEEITCTSCKSKEPAISHCNDCDSLLCTGCDTAHKHMRCFENHRVLHFDQRNTNSEGSDCKVWTIHKPLFCNKHEQMHLEHYCFTCQTPICNSCLTEEKCGKSHRYENISIAEKELTSEISNLIAVANKKIDECESACIQLKTARSKLHTQHNKAHDQIKEVTVKLKRLLDNVCVNTLFQLKKLHTERDLQIIRQLQHTTSILERLHGACKFTANVRQFANLNEFLHLKRSISTQMINLISNPIDCMVNFALGFSTEPNKYEENLREAIGTLHTELSPVAPCMLPTSTPQNDILSSLVEQFQLSTIFSMTQQQLIDLNYNVQAANSGLYNTITYLDSTKANDPKVFKTISDTNNQAGQVNHLARQSTINVKNPNIGALPLQVLSNFGSLGTRKGHFNSPHGFCLGQNDEIVVADTNNHRIVIYDKMGSLKFQFGIAGKDQGELWYPRKIAHMPVTGNYVICDRGNDRSRMQIFSNCGHFQRLIVIKYIDIVAGLTVTSRDEIVGVDSVSPTVFIISPLGKLLRWFDCSNYMCEPSDVAISGDLLYICDFKGHGVVVFRMDGLFLFRIGHENVTCFPNGIDVTTPGLIYVCDSHGNRFHVACYTNNGILKSEFECPYIKISRCCGLKLTSEGYFVTLAKNNHHVLVLNGPESLKSELQNGH